MSKVRRWKGKLVSEAVYQLRQKQSLNCKNIHKKLDSEDSSQKFEEEEIREEQREENKSFQSSYLDGRRIVEFSILAEQLWCVSCKEALSLKYIEREIRKGLGSILLIKCHKCLLVNTVATGKQHSWGSRRLSRFDVNTKAVIGILHSGLGHTHLNRLLSCLNIPTIDFKTYKRYEQEVKQAAENIVKESCHDTADLE